MSITLDIMPGNAGLIPRNEDVRMTIATGLTVTQGGIYQVDVTTATAANNGVANEVKAVSATDALLPQSIFVCALEDGAAGETKMFRLRGYVEAQMKTAVEGTAELELGADATETLAGGTIEGVNVIAFAPETIAAGAKGMVWFDGTGFGTYAVI